MTTDEIREDLLKLSDEKYRDFHSKLIPNVPKDKIIGVRTPVLRKYAKSFPLAECNDFLCDLPHKFYDENNLHGFLIERIKNYDETIKYLDEFLPFVDNWATCDLMSPKILASEPQKLIIKIIEWINSDYVYMVRFGILCLMRYYLKDNFSTDYLYLVKDIKSDEYYINMMIAWYFATALHFRWDETFKIIESKTLSPFVQNKTISKAIESFRITKEQKEILKKYKI